jgi:hypothetical protein
MATQGLPHMHAPAQQPLVEELLLVLEVLEELLLELEVDVVLRVHLVSSLCWQPNSERQKSIVQASPSLQSESRTQPTDVLEVVVVEEVEEVLISCGTQQQ